MTLNYEAPTEGKKSSIDYESESDQMFTFKAIRTAITDPEYPRYFSQLSDTEDIPKHMGKAVKIYHYIPLLDDRNINDQGIDATGKKIENGNLFGSSRDIGTVVGKLPTLTENGGVVNQVGFSREIITGTIMKLGFFYSFTDEAQNFDSDPELKTHLARETIIGAKKICEFVVQRDLIYGAGVVMFASDTATAVSGMGEDDIISYDDLVVLDRVLTENRLPRSTKVNTGSLKTDTRVLPAARIAYIPPELKSSLRRMTGYHGEPAFIEYQHYADKTTLLQGEIGSVDAFRFIEVENMLYEEGKGLEATAGTKVHTATVGDKEKVNVYPLLVVGSGSFTALSFMGRKDNLPKFTIYTKMPGRETATLDNDPYGEKGFSSIKWYSGTLLKHPEWIAVLWSAAPLA